MFVSANTPARMIQASFVHVLNPFPQSEYRSVSEGGKLPGEIFWGREWDYTHRFIKDNTRLETKSNR